MCHHLIGPTSKCDSMMCHLTDTLKGKLQNVIHPKTSMMCVAPYGFILIYFSKI